MSDDNPKAEQADETRRVGFTAPFYSEPSWVSVKRSDDDEEQHGG